jgi:hypothetical protein
VVARVVAVDVALSKRSEQRGSPFQAEGSGRQIVSKRRATTLPRACRFPGGGPCCQRQATPTAFIVVAHRVLSHFIPSLLYIK